jgi:hypothetical protein
LPLGLGERSNGGGFDLISSFGGCADSVFEVFLEFFFLSLLFIAGTIFLVMSALVEIVGPFLFAREIILLKNALLSWDEA